MTDYALTGKKGTGKSKNAVRLIRDRYLRNKRRVATNLDIDLLQMFGAQSRCTYVRVPDKPSAFDLLAAGHGNPDTYDEDENGGMFLDELGTWLNTRTYADKGRADVLDFFAHGRKHGWDNWYIMQNIGQIDKQVRESFIEQTVRHTRFDKVRVPFVGGLLSALFGEKAGFLPRFHMAVYRMGTNPQDLVANRATFVGKDLEKCYDTRQVFLMDYPHGTHSVLSPWHTHGRYLAAPEKTLLQQCGEWVKAFLHVAPPTPLVRPIARTRPDDGWSRVARLCRSLSPEQALWVMARYARASGAR